MLARYPAGGVRLSVTGDPVRPRTAYAAWQLRAADADGVTHSLGYLSRTTDRGRTWSPPAQISGSDTEDVFNNHILVDRRTHRLFNTYDGCTGDTCAIAYRVSHDSGRAWGKEHVVSDHQDAGIPTTPQPGTGLGFDTLTPPVSSISPSGTLAVAWEDSRFSGGRYDEIALSVSQDGRRWSTPHRVNTPSGRPAVLPAVAVTRHGSIGITYYDLRRDDEADAPFSIDYWATTTRDGVHVSPSKHLAGSFDALGAPADLQDLRLENPGLAAVGRHFVSVFEQSTCRSAPCAESNPTDIASARFDVARSRS